MNSRIYDQRWFFLFGSETAELAAAKPERILSMKKSGPGSSHGLTVQMFR
jgi:hypothetical protein